MSEHDRLAASIGLASEHDLAVMRARDEFEHGLPWGYGKGEQEIVAEVDRRVAEWEARIASEKAAAR